MKMKFYKIETGEFITNVPENDIIEIALVDDLLEIDAKTVKKYDLKAGMSGDEVNGIDEDILMDAEPVDIYVDKNDGETYVKLKNIKEKHLYFDDEENRLYSKEDIDAWDTYTYIHTCIGSDMIMTRVIDEIEVSAELISTDYQENYTTYRYQTKKGIVEVESLPNYFDVVADGVENLI